MSVLTQLFLPFLYFSLNMMPTQDTVPSNKIIPESIKEEALIALSYFPELKDIHITFKFKDKIKKSTMQAQPTWGSFFKRSKKREYIILISREIQIENEAFTINDIPSDVIVGWLGHELGHVIDYSDRNNFGMLIFGFKYLFSKMHIKEVERTADTIAVAHGMGDYILQTKNFILDHANISERYKKRIRSFYMSPEEVMELINKGKLEEAATAE
tara:strand:- start:333 stop:974 length:642 start_codon:yes stop_codon:yes gene_type:complete